MSGMLGPISTPCGASHFYGDVRWPPTPPAWVSVGCGPLAWVGPDGLWTTGVAEKSPVAEVYANSLYHYQPTILTSRWWVPGYPIMVGGSVISHIDWRHLRDDHAPPIPHEALARVLDFALRVPYDAKLYVHCQMGGSRSPAFAYLILRGKYGLGKEAALNALNRGFVHRKDHTPEKEPPYGHSPGHWTYMGNVEDYLAARGAE